MFVVGLKRRNSSMRVPFALTQTSVEYDEWEIPVGSVIVDTKFGEGCFGEVHRGVVRGPLPSTRTMKSNICVTVAIKMLKSESECFVDLLSVRPSVDLMQIETRNVNGLLGTGKDTA